VHIRDWLNLAIAIENRSAELYRRFAVLFKHHAGLADYWREMESDEIRHKSILKEVMENLKEDDANKFIHDATVERTDKLLSCINDDLSKMFGNLNDAYECAHELEEKEVEMIFDLLKDDSVNKYGGVHTLLREDQEHLQKLIDFGDVYGKAEWRKMIDASQDE